MPERFVQFSVTQQEQGSTVGQILRSRGVSLGLIRKLKRISDGITIDGTLVRTIDPAAVGQKITLRIPCDEICAKPTQLIADVVYEDDDVIVFNKPAGMTIHPVRDHQTDTLANFYAWHLAQKGEMGAFRPINRLDRNTSGLAVVAKHRFAASNLSAKVDKTYLALCHGVVCPPEGTIEAPIRRKEGFGITQEVGAGGKEAVTHYKTISSCQDMSLLEVTLETGRMHQIRVHFAHLGHPLLGDDMYGGDLCWIKRHALHCTQVSFRHPVTKQVFSLNAPLPDDFATVIAKFFAKG